jgi:non-canonical (house-cleaning) NTP pyrophosphatase
MKQKREVGPLMREYVKIAAISNKQATCGILTQEVF